MVNINKIQEVKERADIVKVANYFGIKEKQCCPFHKEKTPSFSISRNKQIYHCFGCGEGGDCISLVSKLLNINAYESAKQVNLICGCGVDFNTKTSTYDIEKFKYKQQVEKDFKKWINDTYNLLCDYYWETDDKEKIDYYLEILRDGTEEDKKIFYKYNRKWVKELGGKFNQHVPSI